MLVSGRWFTGPFLPCRSRSRAYCNWPWPRSNSDAFSKTIAALISVHEVWRTIPLRPANRIPKQTGSNIREVVWPIVVSIITVWRTVFRPGGARPKEQKAEKDCRQNSQHVALACARRERTIFPLVACTSRPAPPEQESANRLSTHSLLRRDPECLRD